MFSDGHTGSVKLQHGTLFGLSLDSHRRYYYLCVIVLSIVYVFVARLRRSGVGLSTITVRDNPSARGRYADSPTRRS